jgi:hypothetical protein
MAEEEKQIDEGNAVEAEEAPVVEKERVLSELETFSRTQGWNPNYDGPNAKSAEEFLAEGQNIMRQASSDVNDLKGKMDVLISNQTADKMKALATQKEELEATMRNAATVGDTDAYDAGKVQLDSLQAAPSGPSPQDKFNAVEKSMRQNAWYGGEEGKQMEMTVHANAISNGFTAEYIASRTPAEIQEIIESSVKRTFPDQFANPTQRPSGMVTDTPGAPPKSTAFDRVVAENSGEDCEAYFVESGMKDKETWARAVLGEA